MLCKNYFIHSLTHSDRRTQLAGVSHWQDVKIMSSEWIFGLEGFLCPLRCCGTRRQNQSCYNMTEHISLCLLQYKGSLSPAQAGQLFATKSPISNHSPWIVSTFLWQTLPSVRVLVSRPFFILVHLPVLLPCHYVGTIPPNAEPHFARNCIFELLSSLLRSRPFSFRRLLSAPY